MRAMKSAISLSSKLPVDAADDQAADFFRTPRRVIERDEAAAGNAEQVKLVELEMIGQRIEIAGDAAGLRAGRRIGHAFAPALAIEGDDAVTGRGEGGDLRLPDFARAGVWVQRTIGTPVPPVSVNHSFTPGRSA